MNGSIVGALYRMGGPFGGAIGETYQGYQISEKEEGKTLEREISLPVQSWWTVVVP